MNMKLIAIITVVVVVTVIAIVMLTGSAACTPPCV